MILSVVGDGMVVRGGPSGIAVGIALGIAACLIGWTACKPKASPPAQIEVQSSGGLSESLAQSLEAQAAQAWRTGMEANRERVLAQPERVLLRFWAESSPEAKAESILYLGVVWPEGFVKDPVHTPLRSPMKLGVAVDPNAPADQEYQAALQTLLELFWTQVRLAQQPWPVPAQWLGESYSLAQRSMTADWLGQHGKPDAGLAQGCLALLAHATQHPWHPQIERLESSVACLAKVADRSWVPKILDHMPNGHLRVEILRVELLGVLGGALAVSQLRWVQDQAEDPALVSAATQALEQLP